MPAVGLCLIFLVFLSLLSGLRGVLVDNMQVHGVIIYPAIFLGSLALYCLPYRFVSIVFHFYLVFYFTIFSILLFKMGYTDDKASFTLLTIGSNVLAFAFGLMIFVRKWPKMLKAFLVSLIIVLASRASFLGFILASLKKHFVSMLASVFLVIWGFFHFKELIIQHIPMLRWFLRVGLSKRDQKFFDFIDYIRDDFSVFNLVVGYGGGTYGMVLYDTTGVYAHNFIYQCIVEFGLLFTFVLLLFLLTTTSQNIGLLLFVIIVSLLETTFENYITLTFLFAALIYHHKKSRNTIRRLPIR
jgi:hypothetical protein